MTPRALVSELGEVVVSKVADHPSLSKIVIATATEQSLCDVGIVLHQWSVV